MTSWPRCFGPASRVSHHGGSCDRVKLLISWAIEQRRAERAPVSPTPLEELTSNDLKSFH